MSEMDPVAEAAECPPALPEDVVTEILALVPDLVSLFRCSVVCKRWRRLVTDPAFLRRRRRCCKDRSARPSSPLLGFFVQRHRINATAQRKISRLFPSRAPAFVPAPPSGSPLGPGRRFLTSFVRDDDGALDEAKPLAARGGLFLVRLAPRSSDWNGVLRLCVCDLVTGRREPLPPLDASLLDGEGVRGYGLLTAADDHHAPPHRPADGYSTSFQVLLVGFAHENQNLQLIKFSSAAAAAGSGRWCAYDCRQRTGVQLWGPCGCTVAAVAGGTARWLFRGNDLDNPILYTLDVSVVDTGHISATMLPFDLPFNAWPPAIRIPLSTAWLCTIGETPSLVYLTDNRLVVWSHGDHQNDGTLVWRPTQNVQVAVEKGLFGESLSPVSVCAGKGGGGSVLALYHSDPGRAYLIDIQSGSATKLEGWTRSFNYMTVVPCEIDWPMFFTSRLDVQLL